MIETIIITIVAIIGVILQTKKEDIEDHSIRKKIGKWAMIVGVILLVANSIIKSIDANRLENHKNNLEIANDSLNKKLDLCNLSIFNVGLNQNSLEKKYDSLYIKYLSTELLLNDAYKEIKNLTQSTKEGFNRNEEAISHLDKIRVKNARTISPSVKKIMIDELQKFKGTSIIFGTVNTSDEAILFSGELQGIFKQAGWITTDERWLAPDSKYKGIYLFLNKDKQPKYAVTIFNLINSLGYKFQAIHESKRDENNIKIVIGFHE